jgi:hypothetical protein
VSHTSHHASGGALPAGLTSSTSAADGHEGLRQARPHGLAEELSELTERWMPWLASKLTVTWSAVSGTKQCDAAASSPGLDHQGE